MKPIKRVCPHRRMGNAAAFMITGPATKITHLGALKIAMGWKRFALYISCHSLRHTFTTRLCEAGTNIKLMQDILGHQDISTTMNIYADVTKELREKELGNLEAYFAKQVK